MTGLVAVRQLCPPPLTGLFFGHDWIFCRIVVEGLMKLYSPSNFNQVGERGTAGCVRGRRVKEEECRKISVSWTAKEYLKDG